MFSLQILLRRVTDTCTRTNTEQWYNNFGSTDPHINHTWLDKLKMNSTAINTVPCNGVKYTSISFRIPFDHTKHIRNVYILMKLQYKWKFVQTYVLQYSPNKSIKYRSVAAFWSNEIKMHCEFILCYTKWWWNILFSLPTKQRVFKLSRQMWFHAKHP